MRQVDGIVSIKHFYPKKNDNFPIPFKADAELNYWIKLSNSVLSSPVIRISPISISTMTIGVLVFLKNKDE